MIYKNHQLLKTVGALLLILCLIGTAIPGIGAAASPRGVSAWVDDAAWVHMPADANDLTPCDSHPSPLELCQRIGQTLSGWLPASTANVSSYQDLYVYPGGMPFGVKFFTEGVTIVGFGDITKNGKSVNPAHEAGLRLKDRIVKIDGVPLTSAEELTRLVDESGGRAVEVTYRRGQHEYKTNVAPLFCENEGKYKTGMWVRDSGAGIGTVTCIIPENHTFAGLGHGICDTDTGELVPIRQGHVVGVRVSGVVKGLSGTPGEIKGYFNSGKIGSLFGNTECGVWGVFQELPQDPPCEPLPIGRKKELREGTAYLYCTLDSNTVERYEITISDIHPGATGNKCFTVTVTDPALLEKTGGIVQGMSGSPIIQNGKLVGAVTHVLINDPTTGYGIFIENMLSRIGNPAT